VQDVSEVLAKEAEALVEADGVRARIAPIAAQRRSLVEGIARSAALPLDCRDPQEAP